MASKPIHIVPYRGFANSEKLFVKGRVLGEELRLPNLANSIYRNLYNSYYRFETDEVPGATLTIRVNDQDFEVTTDFEGYFTLNAEWQAPTIDPSCSWIQSELEITRIKGHTVAESIKAEGDILLPSVRSDFGILSDVDDTVLKTYVTSRFRLRMLYETFLRDTASRQPVEHTVDLFQLLAGGGDGRQQNPFFYVSKSPWNLYDMLIEFLEMKGFPKGPVLLRDYGLWPSGPFRKHKLIYMNKILSTYPDLPFIMLGDTASRDADVYLKLARLYPNRVKAIYIRKTKDTPNAHRVARLISRAKHVDALLVRNTSEIIAHAKSIGLIPEGSSNY
jgi:phosphatidate phosphatase APP1